MAAGTPHVRSPHTAGRHRHPSPACGSLRAALEGWSRSRLELPEPAPPGETTSEAAERARGEWSGCTNANNARQADAVAATASKVALQSKRKKFFISDRVGEVALVRGWGQAGNMMPSVGQSIRPVAGIGPDQYGRDGAEAGSGQASQAVTELNEAMQPNPAVVEEIDRSGS